MSTLKQNPFLKEALINFFKKAEINENNAYTISNIREILDKNKDVKDYSADVELNEGFLPFIKRNPGGLLGGAAGLGAAGLLAYNLGIDNPKKLFGLAGLSTTAGTLLGHGLIDKYWQRYLRDKTEQETIDNLTKKSEDLTTILTSDPNGPSKIDYSGPKSTYFLDQMVSPRIALPPVIPEPKPGFLESIKDGWNNLSPRHKTILGLSLAALGVKGYHSLKRISHKKEKDKSLDKTARAKINKAPSIEDINKAFPYLSDMFDRNRRTASSFEKNPIVKDVPIASSYGEVADAAKSQGFGLLRRHLLALASRPTVWKGDNAFFFPEGNTGFVVSPKRINEAILRHELGHAEDYIRLGGKKNWEKEYGLDPEMPFDEAYRRAVLLPEARAWHYAGNPINLNPNANEILKDRAFNTYVSGLDNSQPILR